MTSAELLKGLKKLSVTATSSGGPDDLDGKSSSGGGGGKVKFTIKKRNSSSDSAVNKDRSPEGMRSGEGSRKSSRESSDGSPNVSPRTSIDEGIVCKKEDILSLIHHNTKKEVILDVLVCDVDDSRCNVTQENHPPHHTVSHH
uniref:Uncharacterized protein n=1 Tax=Ixodes ricinus TaxID=34613 RepID=A0A0K8RBT0_IXORI